MQNFELDFNKNANLVEFTPHKKKFDIELFTLVPLSERIYKFDEIEYEIYEKLKKKYANRPEEIPFYLAQELDTLYYFYDVDSEGNLLPKLEVKLRSEDVRDSLFNHNCKETGHICLGYTNELFDKSKIWSSKKNISEIALNGIYGPKTKMTTYYIECTQDALKRQILNSRAFLSVEEINKEYINTKEQTFTLKNEWSQLETNVIDPNQAIFQNIEQSENKTDFILNAIDTNQVKMYRVFGPDSFHVAEKDRNGFVYNLIQDKNKTIPMSFLQSYMYYEKENVCVKDTSYLNKLDYDHLNNCLILCDDELEKDYQYARIVSIKGNEVSIKRLKFINKKNIILQNDIILCQNIRKVFGVPKIKKNLLIINENYTFIHENEIITARLVKISKNTVKNNNQDSEGYNSIFVPNVGYIFPGNENYNKYASQYKKEKVKKTTNINIYFAEFQSINVQNSDIFDTETSNVANDDILVFRNEDISSIENSQEILISFNDFKKLYLHTSSVVEFLNFVKKNDILITNDNSTFYFVEYNIKNILNKSNIEIIVSDKINGSNLVTINYNKIKGHIPFQLRWADMLTLTVPIYNKIENSSVNQYDTYKYLPNLYQLLVKQKKKSKSKSKIDKATFRPRHKNLINDLQLRDILYAYSYHDTYATNSSIIYPMFQHYTYIFIKKNLKRKRIIENEISSVSQKWIEQDVSSETERKQTATSEKTIDEKIVDSILSIENVNKRNQLLSEYIEKYCFLFQDPESQEWWYNVVRNSEKIPVLCVHYKFIVNRDILGLKDFLQETKDGYSICKNCKMVLQMQEFETFAGFDDSNNVNQFREKAQNMSNGVQFAGMGDKNLGKFFSEINISNTQFPTSKSLVPSSVSQFQFTTTERTTYGKIGNSFAMNIFEEKYKKLKLGNSVIYSNLFESGSLWDNYMTYLTENPDAFNFESEMTSMKAKIEMESLKITMASYAQEIKTLKVSDPKGEKIKKIAKEYKGLENKFKEIKKTYELKPVKFSTNLNVDVLEKIPLESKFGLAVMVGLKYWYLSFYGNRFENLPNDETSSLDFKKKFETIWFNELTEFSIYREMYYYIEDQNRTNNSIQQWINMHKNHLMTALSKYTMSFSNVVKEQNIYDYFQSLSGNTEIDEKLPFRQDYNIPQYIIQYPGNINWIFVQEIIEYHTNIYYDQPTVENYNRLIEMNAEVQNEWRNYKEWYQQNYYLFLKAKNYNPLIADTPRNRITYLVKYFDEHNIDYSGITINSSEADLLKQYEAIYFNFKFDKLQRKNKTAFNPIIKKHIDLTSIYETEEFKNFKKNLDGKSDTVCGDPKTEELYLKFNKCFTDTTYVVENIEIFINKMQTYNSSRAQSSLQNLIESVVSDMNQDVSSLLLHETTVKSFLSDWSKRYLFIAPKQKEFVLKENETLILEDRDSSIQICQALLSQLNDFNRLFSELTNGTRNVVEERIKRNLKMKGADNTDYENMILLLGDTIEDPDVLNPWLSLMNTEKIDCIIQYFLSKPDLSLSPILMTNAITFYFTVFFGFNEELLEVPNTEDEIIMNVTQDNRIKVKIFMYYFKKQMRLKKELSKSMMQTRKEIQEAGYYENFPPVLDPEYYIKNKSKRGVNLVNLQDTLDFYRKSKETPTNSIYPANDTEYLVETELDEDGTQPVATNYQIYSNQDQDINGIYGEESGTEGLLPQDLGINPIDMIESGDDPNEIEYNYFDNE